MKDNKENLVSVIFHQKNDSPKFFEIKKSKIYLYLIGLPILTVIGVAIGIFALAQNSPIHMFQKYKQNIKLQSQINSYEDVEKMLYNVMSENKRLQAEINKNSENPANEDDKKLEDPTKKTEMPNTQKPSEVKTINSIGLSTLSLFKPIQNQKDLTRPARIGLSGFNVTTPKDGLHFHFNIIPTQASEDKISGHIVVLMKSNNGIFAYPEAALASNDLQINFSAGETFSTQRFRPVDSSFKRPAVAGNYAFSIFIFSKEGDLIHYQAINMPVKL